MAGRAARGGRKTITPETGISAKFDDTEYKEQGAGYDGDPPPAGLYPMKLSSVGQHTTSDTAIVWTFDITEGKYAGWRGWMYSDLDNQKWKTQNILVALGLMEPEGEINHTFESILKDGGPVRGRVKLEEYNDEYKPKLQTVIKASASSTADDDEEEADEDFDDKKPARGAGKPRSRGRTKPDEGPDSADEGTEDGPDRDEREEELSDLSLAQLKKAAKETGLALSDYRGKDAEEIIDLILDKEFPEDGDDDGDTLDLSALEKELEEMSLEDLKKKAKEFGLTRAGAKELSDEDDYIDWIMEKAEEQNPSF